MAQRNRAGKSTSGSRNPSYAYNLGLSGVALKRLQMELKSLSTNPLFGIHTVCDDNDIRIVHALIMGVEDTPYECGFFYFVLNYTNDYPFKPPEVRFMTTDAGGVTFNPHLYASGTVCLNILGTWNGPSWSPAMQLNSLLLFIQSFMSDNRYFNEHGVERERCPSMTKNYAERVRHETLRVAVCGMLENECHLNLPEELRTIMENKFLESYNKCIEIANKHLHMDSQPIKETCCKSSCQFKYSDIITRLKRLHATLSSGEDSRK